MTYAGSRAPIDPKLLQGKILTQDLNKYRKDKNFKNVTINMTAGQQQAMLMAMNQSTKNNKQRSKREQ